MKFRIALLTATVLAAPVALSHVAKAQPVTGLYAAGGAGYSSEEKFKSKDITVSGANVPFDARVSLDGGFTGEAAVGYGFGNGFRVEVEGDYIQNRLKNVTSEGPGVGGKAAGQEQKYGAFLNGYYDFDVGLPYLYPYLGGGVGWQVARFDGAGGTLNGGDASFDKDKSALAYQGIAGVAVPIAPIPGLSATVEYRFIGLAGSRKYNGSYAGAPVGAKILHEYNNQVLVGLRYAFGVTPPPAPAPSPAPAPVAAPAPAPAKTYLVFFDWDKSDLTPRATEIIAQAASDSHTQQTTDIVVNGYTDTSGTVAYNQGLSERRAQAVESQLVTDGVQQSEISIHAYGETHLLVPTGPGVREPQNRRVQIILQ